MDSTGEIEDESSCSKDESPCSKDGSPKDGSPCSQDESPCEPMAGDAANPQEQINSTADNAAEDCKNENLSGKASSESLVTKERSTSKQTGGDAASPKVQSPAKPLSFEIEAKLRRWTRHGRDKKVPKFDIDGFNRWKRKMGIALDQKLFIVADVVPDLKKELLDRGWIENTWDPDGPWFDFKWKIKKQDVDYDALAAPQKVNHFQKTAEFTTKAGLNRHLKEAQDLNEFAVDSWYPKTYHLAGQEEISNFTNDFKIHKAEGILKEWVKQKDSGKSPSESIPDDVVRTALTTAKRRLVDIDALLDEEENEAELRGFWITDEEWAVLNEVDFEQPGRENTNVKKFKEEYYENERMKEVRAIQEEEALQRRVAELQKIAEKFQERQRKEISKKKPWLKRKSTSLPQGFEKTPSRTSLPSSTPAAVPAKASSSTSSPPSLGTAAPSSFSGLTYRAYPGAEEPLNSQELLDNVKEVIKSSKKAFPQFSLAGSRNTWVLKPHARARGEGVQLASDLDEILSFVGSSMTGSWMCQKYLENPFLVDGRKNDIRQWVMVTCWNPLTVWFFSRTYVRMAADQFNLTDIKNTMGHVSNNNITEFHPDYDADDDYYCFAMIDTEYQAEMQKRWGFDAYTDKVVPEMKQIVIQSLSIFQEALCQSVGLGCSYEMLGFDFMVDDDLGVWLIEINSSPSMKYATPVHRVLVPQVMRDSVRVVLGGEPKEPEKGYFELIHESDVFSSHKTSDALSGLKVEGQRLLPPPPEKPEVVLVDEDTMREKREAELQAMVEKMKLKKAKEQKKVARRERIMKSLKKGALQRALKSKMKATEDTELEESNSQDETDLAPDVENTIECGKPSDALEALLLSKKMPTMTDDGNETGKGASPIYLPAIQTPGSSGTPVPSSSRGLLSPKRFLQDQGAAIVSTNSSR